MRNSYTNTIAPGYESAEQHNKLGVSHLELAQLYDSARDFEQAAEHRAYSAWHRNQARLWTENGKKVYCTMARIGETHTKTLRVERSASGNTLSIRLTESLPGQEKGSCTMYLDPTQIKELKKFFQSV